MAARYYRGETQPVIVPVATPQAVAVCDLVALNAGSVVRASDWTWTTDLATTQAAFVAAFLGVSGQQKDAGVARVPSNSQDNRIRIDSDGIFEFDCASATFNVGDFVGPAKDTGNALLNQKVVAVSGLSTAIGVVIEAGTAITKVRVKILSKSVPQAR